MWTSADEGIIFVVKSNVLCKGSTGGTCVVLCREGSVLVNKGVTESGHNSGSVKDVGVSGGWLKLEAPCEVVSLGLSHV